MTGQPAGDPREAAERAALRLRLGQGARFDAPNAPAADLTLARRGTAYFARALNALGNAELDAPSRVDGWSRRHVVAAVGYQGRALCRLVESARTGEHLPMYASAAARDAEIALGATLPAEALRHLVAHAAVHLDVEWRDLADAQWDAVVQDLDGRRFPVRETARLRALFVWRAALELASGAALGDVPAALRAAVVEN